MIPPGELTEFLKTKDNFLIATHMSPDGDALGSAIALALVLEKIGKKTLILCRDRVPEQYLFLPGHARVYTFGNAQPSGIDVGSFRNLILVDCNEIKRTGMEKSPLAALTFESSLVIDHHETERSFGDIRWVVPEIAATGMMIYFIVKALGVPLTREIAVNLYTAIIVDTGNFRFENTSSEVLSVAAALAGAGATPHVIHREVNEAWSENRFRLFVRVLNTLRIEDDIAITAITKKMMEETSTSSDDTESFVSFPRVMKRIKVSALIREVGADDYKISLRSRDDIDVARIAESFGGGGHKNAAGCTIKADIETAKAEILKRVKELLKG